MFKLYDVVRFKGDIAWIVQIIKKGIYVIQLTNGDKALVNSREIKKIEVEES